jgi:hypothetical protein
MSDPESSPVEASAPVRPQGWMYHDWSLLGLKVPYYASPVFQVVLLSFVCFL